MHFQVRIFNLDIIIRFALHMKPSFKFLSSPSSLIQIHMSDIKGKKTQVIYTYQLTVKQIFMCKGSFFMSVANKTSVFSFFLYFFGYRIGTIFHVFELYG